MYVRNYRIRLLLRVLGVESLVRIQVQDPGFRELAIGKRTEAVPGQPMALAGGDQAAKDRGGLSAGNTP